MEQIEIEGYKIWRNDRNNEGGGIAIAVKEKYKHLVMEISKEQKTEESIWITIGR